MVGDRKRANFWIERLIINSAEKFSVRGTQLQCQSKGKNKKGLCILESEASACLFDLEVPSVCAGPDVKWDLV